MSIRTKPFSLGEFYHVYNRGNSKQKIFHDQKDYKHFVQLLYVYNTTQSFCLSDLKKSKSFDGYLLSREQPIVSIGAYCLMPNHFHVLLTPLQENGVSLFMQKISTAYVMYYNKKYAHTGGLFEGKFKAQHVDNDTYLKYIFSYIHLNPITLLQKDWKEHGIKNKTKAFNFLHEYTYSSLPDFFGDRRVENKIIDLSQYPQYFKNIRDIEEEILSWLLEIGKIGRQDLQSDLQSQRTQK